MTERIKRGQPGYVSPLKGRAGQLTPGKKAALQAGAARYRASRPVEVRFWAKADKSGDCWIWTGAVRHKDGYGMFFKDGQARNAHRVAWELTNGPIPEGLVIDHICRNIRCVNPAHLRTVTPKVNATENCGSPVAQHAKKTHCHKGHPLSGANLALYTPPRKRTRHGHPTKPGVLRVCLTCTPSYWRFAVIPRDPPPGARKWREPRRAKTVLLRRVSE